MTRWRAIILGSLLGVAVTAGAALGTGCAAPSLPIPPPTALASSPDETGHVTVTGHADPTAFVFVLNEMTQVGVIVHADPDGTFTARISATVGDDLTVWQMIGNEASQQNMITVHAP